MAGIDIWLKRWQRLFRNRRIDASDVRAALPQVALNHLTAQIAASEQQHSGEIRICVEAGLPWSYIRRDATVRDRALTLFGKLHIWDTAQNNGVLIYLLMAEQAIEIVADRGLNSHVNAETWVTITAALSQALASQQAEAGLSEAVSAVSTLLCTYFPAEPGLEKTNQLPDTPLLLI
jgi:uncharacterized membrane protein